MKIVVVLTCFNRKYKTQKCIQTLVQGNPKVNFSFVVVDDNSNDGTVEMLSAMKNEYDINLIEGTGDLFYCGGMRVAMNFVIDNLSDYNYLLMVNDDVEFFDRSIENMIDKSKGSGSSIVVGATKNDDGSLSYGAIKYDSKKSIRYKKIGIEESNLKCDTFNANCVLIPNKAFKESGGIDSNYIHSLGDFDYGLSLSKRGWNIYPSDKYVGICNNNSINNTWNDTSLTRLQRLRKKEDIKGAPLKQWIYFLKKNFGINAVIRYGFTPYIRILLGM